MHVSHNICYVQIIGVAGGLAGPALTGPIISSAANTTVHCIMDNPDQLETKYLSRLQLPSITRQRLDHQN